MPWKSTAERRAAQKRARLSLENALRKWRGTAGSEPGDEHCDPEVLRRERVSRPRLADLVAGRPSEPGVALKRNAAWHSDDLPQDGAPLHAFRAAQRGPRLESRGRPVGLPDGRAVAIVVPAPAAAAQPPSEDATAREVLTAPLLFPPPFVATVVSHVHHFEFLPVLKYPVITLPIPKVIERFVTVTVPSVRGAAATTESPPTSSVIEPRCSRVARGPDIATFLVMAEDTKRRLAPVPLQQEPMLMIKDRQPLFGAASGTHGDVSTAAFPELFAT